MIRHIAMVAALTTCLNTLGVPAAYAETTSTTQKALKKKAVEKKAKKSRLDVSNDDEEKFNLPPIVKIAAVAAAAVAIFALVSKLSPNEKAEQDANKALTAEQIEEKLALRRSALAESIASGKGGLQAIEELSALNKASLLHAGIGTANAVVNFNPSAAINDQVDLIFANLKAQLAAEDAEPLKRRMNDLSAHLEALTEKHKSNLVQATAAVGTAAKDATAVLDAAAKDAAVGVGAAAKEVAVGAGTAAGEAAGIAMKNAVADALRAQRN